MSLDDFLRETADEFAKAHAKQEEADASKGNGKPANCPCCGAGQWNDADWIVENLWECGSLVNAGKLMQSPNCMRTEIVNLKAEIESLRKRLNLLEDANEYRNEQPVRSAI